MKTQGDRAAEKEREQEREGDHNEITSLQGVKAAGIAVLLAFIHPFSFLCWRCVFY